MLAAIIVAGGSSRRAGFDKLFAPLAGRSVLEHSLRAFANCEFVEQLIVVGRAVRIDEIRKIADTLPKVIDIVPGGAERQNSVRCGLEKLADSLPFVAVHDAARPLITPAQIERTFAAAQTHGAATLAAQVADTLKRVDAQQFANENIERANLFAMQTPQIFAREVLLRAYELVEKNQLAITDEVSAVQFIGEKVFVVANDEANFKITFPNDLALAELLLARRSR